MQGSETCLTGTQLHAATVLEIRGEFPLIPSSASSAHPGVHISQNTRLSFHRLCAQSCPTLCNSMDYSPPRLLCPQDSLGKNTGVRSHSLLQGIFQPRDWTQASSIARRFSTVWLTKEALLLLLLSRFSRVRLCATPQTAGHQAPPSLGFSRQEHWSGLPFPSPMHESEVA